MKSKNMKTITAAVLSAAVLSAFPAAGCGSAVNADAAAATLDGRDISMGVANFMAQCQAVSMDSYLLSYYGEDMWSQASGSEDGSTMTESVKDNVMENVQEYYLMDAHAADYSISLSDDDKAAITQAAEQFLSDNSSEALDALSATKETVEEALRLYKVQALMRTAIEAEIDTEVSEEECKQKTFSYVKFNKESESSSDTSADDAQQSDPQADAQAFLENAKEDMQKAADDGEYALLTCSYGDGDLSEDDNTTSMELEVLQAADKLKKGKLADSLVETDTAYYVIRMDSLDDKEAAENKKESILSQRRTEKYDEVLDGYIDSCEWSINEEEWAKVNFDKLYTLKQAETSTDDEAGGSDASGTDTDADAGTDGSDASGTDTDADAGADESDASGTDAE